MDNETQYQQNSHHPRRKFAARRAPKSSLLIDEEAGKRVNRKKIDAVAEERVAHVMKNEALAGIGIANDGEQGRVGFQTYVPQRMSGFGGVSSRPYGREFIEFPKFTEHMMERIPKTSKVFDAPEAIGEFSYHGEDQLHKEIDRAKRNHAENDPAVAEWFMHAPPPGIIATTMLNASYESAGAYPDGLLRAPHHA